MAPARARCLRLLAKIYPPTIGQVSIRGSVAPLIEMGAGFNPELSGLDNILFNGALLGFSRGEMLDKVEQIHEFTGLREFADMPLKYYSSGMYMRLAFAIATEVNPDILLVDESLGVGDAAFQEKAKARIRSLLDRTQAVVLVSHDLPSRARAVHARALDSTGPAGGGRSRRSRDRSLSRGDGFGNIGDQRLCSHSSTCVS